ncbi:DUF2461 domain-containing protein [Flavobacterium sp. ZT3R18]|uniref:DUF2461 domain-containing protein n=1 Tax=Flavobacterium sp. ZT3R18 TaxID=2594429 RepID=UPI00117A4306|nr:DUF2461 domain-containing protein [Flavobacterium sp. ZT3R18]TRX36547.1 DUF2461 domain-containing protein [Flavobacterium sp. ZT3R18]
MLSKDTLQFLEDLKVNNNRDWFLENKKRYEAVKEDYHQLAASFLEALKPLDSSLELLEVKNCTFRINRDVRFSKDKSPYKTNLGIWISSGTKGWSRSGYYIQIEKGASFVAGGFYSPEMPDLKKIRKEIAFFHEDLVEILKNKTFQEEYNGLDITETNCLKNAPKDYPKDHQAIEFLKLKSFTASHQFDSKLALQKDFVSVMAAKMITLKPLNDFINRALTSE